jgi:hypothetical protein
MSPCSPTATEQWGVTSTYIFATHVTLLSAVTLEAKLKRTEEDSVSCPMKYSTDVEWRQE